MKLIMENWRDFLKEEEEEGLDIQTLGDLRAEIGKARMAKRMDQAGEEVKGAVKGAVKGGFLTALGAFLGLPQLGGAVNVGELAVKSWKLPDEKVTGTGLDYLRIDPELSAIVSSDAENNFLNNFTETLKELPDETRLENIDVDEMLRNFLFVNYNQRTVTSPELEK